VGMETALDAAGRVVPVVDATAATVALLTTPSDPTAVMKG